MGMIEYKTRTSTRSRKVKYCFLIGWVKTKNS